jgi:hypothetical protein
MFSPVSRGRMQMNRRAQGRQKRQRTRGKMAEIRKMLSVLEKGLV